MLECSAVQLHRQASKGLRTRKELLGMRQLWVEVPASTLKLW